MDGEANSDCPLSAIIDGSVDKQSVADFLVTSTIETVLGFESVQGQSPLVSCVEKGVSHLETVRCMLNSGLYYCETIDSSGRAALANLAFECGDNKQHIKSIIDVVVNGVDQATACYKLLKLNSLELFRVYVEDQDKEDQDEEELFQSIATAIIHLNARRFPLLELRLYAQWKLADYGYRKLTGDWTDGKTLDYKNCILVISDCWSDIIQHNYASNDIVDDRFMHRLRMIHNHLYFLQFIKFLNHLLIWETVFCVAIFINIYDEPNNHRFYRLMISKGTVIECLGAMVPALERVKAELAKIEPEIGNIVSDMMHNDSKYDALIDEMVLALEASNIKNKKFMVSNFRKKQDSGLGAKHELAKEVAKVFKRAEKSYCDTKMVEIKALESRGALITKIRTRLGRVVHPENVCNRLMAEMRKNAPPDTIVATIIADEAFNFTDLSLAPDVIETIGQCYCQMKPFYSLAKIHKCVSIFATLDPSNMSRFTACAKRLLTVIGEAINNTKNTPNMPDTRVEAAVQRMLMYQFKTINNWHRNTFTHDLSRARLEVKEGMEWQLLKQMPQHICVIGLMLELLLIAIAADIRHSFYEMLHQCETLESLRALLIYVGDNDILREVEDDWWEDVLKYYEQASALLQHVRQQPVGQTAQFAQVERSFNMQLSIVEELKGMGAIEAEFSYESVRKTCTSCNDLATVKRLLSWKLDSYNPVDTLERMCNSWDADISNLSHIAWDNPQLLQLNPLAALTTLTRLQKALLSVGQYDYAHHTRRLVEALGCVELHTVDEKGFQELSGKLVPYYQNVFQLDVKWNVLKEFCVARQTPWNGAREHELRQQDQRELQQMFDDRRATLRLLFVQCGIRTVDDLIAKFLTIPGDALAAMEYVQVELCQMLLAVKYFGDNFEALKHSIPMLQGKSYRNYLAHDALSYDILTRSGDEKCVINAFVFAHTPVSLFSVRPAVPSLSFPRQDDTRQWIDQQQELRAAIVSGDVTRIHALVRAGAEIKGFYYGSPDIRHHPTTRRLVTDLVEWLDVVDPNVVALLNRYFPNFEANYRNPQRRLRSALIRGNFEDAFELSKHGALPDSLLVWPNLPLAALRQRCEAKGWQTVLKELLDHGNEQCAGQVIKDSENVIATQADGKVMNELLHHAMLRGMYQSASHLFSQMSWRLVPKTVELAIVVHWNDLFQHAAAKPVLDDDSNLQRLIAVAVQVSNFEVMGYFLDRKNGATNFALQACYMAAACCGNDAVLEKLLEYYPPDGTDDTVLSEPLYRATTNNHWDCVRLLLQHDAAADVMLLDSNGDKSCTLLMLIQLDQVDLIRCIRHMNCSVFCSPSVDHPFSVALDYDTLSEEMSDAIKSLGFSCLNTPKILHATVEDGTGHPLWGEIWEQIDGMIISHPCTECADQLRALMNVLYRWRSIAFIEMPYEGKTALSCAVATDDELKVLGELITRARLMRTLEGDGLVLGDLAIGNGSTAVWYGGHHEHHGERFARGCSEIISRVGTLLQQQTELQWQDCPIDIGELSIRFATLDAASVHLSTASTLQMRDTSSLADNLHDLLTIANALFPQHSTVYATVTISTRTIHFLRVEGWCCAYDVFTRCRLDTSVLDLSCMINARLARGNTVLFNAIMCDCELASIKLLVENGANPLLADNNGNTAITAAIEHKSDPEFARNLLEACIEKDFRDAHGCALAEMVDGSGRHRLLHLANACGHQTAARFLRCLESRKK